MLAASCRCPVRAGQAARPRRLGDRPSRAVLKDLAAYDGGINSDAFWKMRTIVLAAKDDPAARKDVERKLLGFLVMDGSLVAKDSVCQMLRIIGGDASVPILSKMLAAPNTTDMARYALEKIPGDAAESALLDALGKTNGDVKLGVISSLADRKSAKAVPALAKLLVGSNPDAALAAAYGLGPHRGQGGRRCA